MKQGILPWSPSTFPGPSSLFLHPATTCNPKFRTTNITAIASTMNSVDESPSTARERRQLRQEKRESKLAYNWREEVEDRLIKKPKKRYASWMEELNLDNLALLGPQWWVVRVSRVSGQDTAERMARSMARNFPSLDFKVYAPSVHIKRKLKNGSISTKPKPLFPGCIFLRCVMNKELHDFIRECNGVGGFVGSKVGNTKRQINKPRPVEADDVEAIFKQAKAEQEKADRAFEAQQQTEGTKDSERIDVTSPLVSKDDAQSNPTTRARGRGKKASKQPTVGKAMPLAPGSTVVVASGSFAGFSGTLKKINESGLATIGLTLFGKETLADIDVSEIVSETT
ncbi:hypothetical protein F511_21563 [Dorcoceras hygrometricum]|uniref:NusG-like N-terminal domain-containing protein n=1 Tax=Dorcoceras hygrometricum TaxID=472368 RepID=A0A2Z7AAZ5_9LAMI|nr:hypothetical protein F511_21563 [Dorcoceras hygrometricum]